eukprot:268079-Rhodomonas_salina.1
MHTVVYPCLFRTLDTCSTRTFSGTARGNKFSSVSEYLCASCVRSREHLEATPATYATYSRKASLRAKMHNPRHVQHGPSGTG